MQKPTIHFVCRGNIFRSTLAEMYTKSIAGDDLDVSSSGIEAAHYAKGFRSKWTEIIVRDEKWDLPSIPAATQTTNELLARSDLIIFLNEDVYSDALTLYDLNPAKCIVWRIKDREDWSGLRSVSFKRAWTARTIKRKVGRLVEEIKRGGWVDIVDNDNKPLDFKLPIAVATSKKDLMYRGCHAIITTPDHGVLVQKRSKNIFYSPSMIEITLGGHVDAGEEPLRGIMRETREEAGLVVKPEMVRLLEVVKLRSYHPSIRRYTNGFIYCYHICLDTDKPILIPEASEVARIKKISHRQARRLVRYHSLRGLGRLSYSYGFYKLLLDDISTV